MISWMAMDFFAKSPVLAFPLFALVIFLVVFTGVCIRTLKLPRHRIHHLATLPLGTQSLQEASQQNQEKPIASDEKEENHVS